jgi:uncharacterized protein (TIRG00374 family)
MKKKWARIFRWSVSVLFLVILFATIQKGEFIHLIEDARFEYIIASFGISFLMIVASCAKWRLLLDLQGIHFSFGYLLKIYLIGYYFSNLLPSAVGGDVVRSYYTGARSGCQTRTAVAVFLERFTGILFLLGLVIVAPLLQPELYQQFAIFLPAIVAAGILMVIAIVGKFGVEWFSPLKAGPRGEKSFGWLGPLSPVFKKLVRVLSTFQERLLLASRALQADRSRLFWVVVLTGVFYGLTWLNVYSAFLVFGDPPAFRAMCAVIPAIMLVFLIPISAGNIGLAEGAYVFYFGLLGIHAEISLAMSLFIRFKLLVIGVLGFLFYIRVQDVHLEKMLPQEPTSE